jgi:N4-gp56 family major capsid protein
MSTPDYVSVTLAEYGKMVARTKALKLFSFTDVDPAIANIVAYNMIDTIDSMVNDVLTAGTNVLYSGNATSTATVDATDTLSSAEIRKAITKLRAGKAVPRKGSLYAVYLHPEVSHDLRAETGAASWRLPHEYQTNENLWAGEIGNWEGGYFIETPRAKAALDGAASAKVYRTIVAGREALAEAVAEEPHTVIAPVTDNFQRFHKVGWYAALGWSLYRQEALYRIESGSSVA